MVTLLDSVIAAAPMTGVVIEVIRKIGSGSPSHQSPMARKYSTLPFRAIAATAPAKAPASSCDGCEAAICANRDGEKPSASGSLAGMGAVRAGGCGPA